MTLLPIISIFFHHSLTFILLLHRDLFAAAAAAAVFLSLIKKLEQKIKNVYCKEPLGRLLSIR